ncbi:MAG: polyribonucleotide nucleotidyltransferase [Schwartzia succinivorans]|jgi:polyribonucleotide nucleotidyltransferase|uniref:polyribonucleotide nucleotidyltransferase n=1 Tax=Schwartzia succinivorans TaxID=55507 RepID=UPI002352CA39|nr:polyribonucleotide nucleotidyltransferase [Schwartzia succinivorans]MBE6098125.1 polyribonucleotide nucleotidyltransferase [Schwartzia succinivorans]MDY6294704.1 polyribonucleotide nucleotidyltransferase [Schwartzia succinivorans]
MQSFEMEVGGRSFVIENGKMAKQANGAVLVRYGDTVVLVTATASKEPREGVDFFPLTVDYEEKMYAVGKIPGGFIKREGRPGNSAILCARLIDRPIRPLFNKGFRNDVQIVATVMSVEQDNPPEIAAMIGASCALCVSDIPFNGPIAGVRVGRVDGKFVINPTVEQRKVSDLNLTVAGSHDAVMMVEAGANELPEDVVLEAILFGHKEIQRIVEFQRDIMAACGKEKREMKLFEIPEALEKGIREYAAERLDKAVRNPDKLQRDEDIAVVNADTMEHFLVEYPDNAKEIAQVLHDVEKDIVRHMITHEKIRPDGRALDEVRPVSCEVGILPRAHGSGLFTRGQTQILTVTTLGSLSDEQVLDGLGTEKSKRYIHQYNFPGYSVGEARPIRSPGRREIGHGALAERALVPVIPSEEEFPYTLRLVSEVLESNGSSSMGSVCGSTLSLMHAGVPIKRPVAGVAMGLVKEGDEYTILTDIQGMEDALGDMDFKVAGTEVGVTAIQMDIKIAGITREILSSALAQAKRGREFIMGKMMECISEPAADLSPYAPRVTTMHIKTDKIRTVIGPGGKMIKKIVDETGTQIDIEEDGTIRISATDQDAAKKAVAIIEELVREVEVGAVYKGRVTRTMTFGAFVEVLPGKEGLCHISQLAKERVEKVEDVVNVGDELEVKVTEIDRQGRVNLSHKVLL